MRDWINQRFGRIVVKPPAEVGELLIFDARTGVIMGRNAVLSTRSSLLGFAADGRSVWTMTYTAQFTPGGYLLRDRNGEPVDEPDGTMCVQQWAVPTGIPPLWLLAVTVFSVALAIFDWRRGRRIARATP